MRHQGPPIISLPYVRLYHESTFCKALGMSTRQFRAWLRTLGVPSLELKGGRYIEHTTFAIALISSLQIHDPPCHTTPGSPSKSKGRVTPPTLTPDQAAISISQLMLSSHLTEREARSDILRKARKGADALALMAYTAEKNRKRGQDLLKHRIKENPVVAQILQAATHASSDHHTTPSHPDRAAVGAPAPAHA
jgi:hypothetical protein